MTDENASPTYRILALPHPYEGCEAITCLRCGRTSYHRDDIANRYCAYCKIFHDDLALKE